jgi:hydrogenase expression/formation protein HypE
MSAFSATCPIPQVAGDRIQLAHGEGARLTRRLIREVVLQELNHEFLRPMADAATLPPIEGAVVFTTDSYVVSPLFFPGGDIGTLAVHGTINDLAVSAAEPLYLSLSLILEEGLPIATLREVVRRLGEAAADCGVPVVTGDTKVVPRGAADGLFVNTAGIGRLRPGIELEARHVRPGDRILVSGTLADHGIAILAAREALGFEGELKSDTAPLHELVRTLIDACGSGVRFLRDPTRGGLSAVLHELAEGAGRSMVLDEAEVPLTGPVRGACELLGLDPLHVANEGKLMAVVAEDRAEEALEAMRRHPLGSAAAMVGTILADQRPQVLVRGPLGATRVLDEPSGAPLPRIC